MDLPKEWADLQRKFEEEEHWRRQGEGAIRMEMDRRIAAYFDRRSQGRVHLALANAKRAELRAEKAKQEAVEAQRIADAVRLGLRTDVPNQLTPLQGRWNPRNVENQRDNARRMAQGLPPRTEREQPRKEEEPRWRFRSR